MMGSVVTVILFVKFVFEALVQTLFGVVDQTHYHVKTGKSLIKALIGLVRSYLVGVPRMFITHFKHSVYLYQLGLDGVENLKDNGCLVWTESVSANKVDSKPATRVTGFKDNASGNMEHLSISSSAMLKLWEVLREVPDFRFPDSVFLDFGCGTGFAMIAAMTQPFNSVIGVEMDNHTMKLAEENIETARVCKDRQIKACCQDYALFNEDMCNFSYTMMPKHYNTVVLYLYDPLWTVSKPEAHKIYLHMLTNAQKFAAQQQKKVIVAYFFAGWYNGDALPALKEVGAVHVKSFEYDSLNFCSSSECHVYQLH